MARRDHLVAFGQARAHFHQARAAQAELHLHPACHAVLGVSAGFEPPDPVARALGHDGLLGHHQRLYRRAEHGRDARKHARAQRPAAVVQARAHGHRAAVGVDLRVDGEHLGREGLPGQRVELDARALARAQQRLVALGQAEVHDHAVDVLEVDDVRAVLEVVAHVHVAYARHPVERRHDAQARERRLGQRELGLRHLQAGGALVERALAHETLRHQLLVALVVGLGDGQLGPRLLHLGARQLVVELHQHLPLAHARAVAQMDVRDAPAHLGPQHHAAARTQAAHGLGLVAQGHAAHGGGLHAGGLRPSGLGLPLHRRGGGLRCGAGPLQPPGSRARRHQPQGRENPSCCSGRSHRKRTG